MRSILILTLVFSSALSADPNSSPLTTVRIDKGEAEYVIRSCVVAKATHDLTDKCMAAWNVKFEDLHQLQERMIEECSKHGLSVKGVELCQHQVQSDVTELASSSPSSIHTFTVSDGNYTGWVLTFLLSSR